MASSVTAGRAQLLFILCLPLAILMGYLLSDPLDPGNTLMAALMVGVLSIPLLMRWHHPMLILTWNAALAPFFLPGQAFAWMPLAFVGLGFAIVNRFTNTEARIVSVPSLNRSLLFLLVVVMVTAYFRGGVGLRSLGSGTYGGRDYAYVLAAIVGYFALVSRRIPREHANFYVALFFLPGLTALVPNLAYFGGQAWYFLFSFFPPLYAYEQAMGDYSVETQISRVFGLTVASVALLCWLLARYGLRGVVNWRKPWPMFLFLVALAGCVFCGFRSIVIIFLLVIAAQFWFEKLLKMRTVFIGLGALLLAGVLIAPAADRLPLVVQRSISFLPLKLDPMVQRSAAGSTDWRLSMWQELLPEIPKYLLVGKGYGIDPTELDFAQWNNRRYGMGFSGAMAAGDYHSGPLSLIIPFGIWGVIGFVWFIAAALRYLYRQYRFGHPDLQKINTFFLGYFIVRLVFYIFIFGGFFSDLFLFTGLIALSVSLNGDILPQPAEAPAEPESKELAYQEQLASTRAS